tara:strand:+ start:584 stop:1918 length:1335 start_codon:yes stop_codon:yes gene_type:complete
MVERPRGTRDFGVNEMAERLALERELDNVANCHGYNRVQTPIFERLDLFTAKSGPEVVNQLYAFKDRSDRDLTLRPELTAPVMRMVADSMRADAKPLRLSYFGQCFRYEESKKGRYREFYQYGIEHIGASGPLVEAEVIALAIRMMHATGLQDWTVRVGHVGILRTILNHYTNDNCDLEELMRLLDKGRQSQEALDDFWDLQMRHNPYDSRFTEDPPIGELQTLLENFIYAEGNIEAIDAARKAFDQNELDNFQATIDALEALAPAPPKLEIDFTISRGLDYYTGMVFEFHVPSLRGESQVLGGGSYSLMHLFDQPDLDPCCGFGLGFDRVLLAMENEGVSIQKQGQGQVAVIPLGDVNSKVLPIVGGLRNMGHIIHLEVRDRGLKRAMRWADGIGVDLVMIIGERDIESGNIEIKRLIDGHTASSNFELESIHNAISCLLNLG